MRDLGIETTGGALHAQVTVVSRWGQVLNPHVIHIWHRLARGQIVNFAGIQDLTPSRR